jgi:hypothetical protein
MNIDDLKYGDLRMIASLFQPLAPNTSAIDKNLIGKKVIVRTYSAGVHYGEIVAKEGAEVILKNARRLYYWKTVNGGISLSEIANHGVHNDSKVCESVSLLWLQPIEIIPCAEAAINSIEAKDVYKA